MDIETLAQAIEILAEQVGKLTNTIKALDARVERLENEVDDFNFASDEHYHDEYANAEGVNRLEMALNSKYYRLEKRLESIEERIGE